MFWLFEPVEESGGQMVVWKRGTNMCPSHMLPHPFLWRLCSLPMLVPCFGKDQPDAELMDSYLLLDGIPFVLPDLDLSFSTLFDIVPHKSQACAPKFLEYCGIPFPQTQRGQTSFLHCCHDQMHMIFQMFLPFRYVAVRQWLHPSTPSPQHCNECRDQVAEENMVYHSEMSAMKPTALYITFVSHFSIMIVMVVLVKCETDFLVRITGCDFSKQWKPRGVHHQFPAYGVGRGGVNIVLSKLSKILCVLAPDSH